MCLPACLPTPFFLLFFFNTGFLCVAPAVLELIPQTRLASNSETSLPLPPERWDQSHVPPPPGYDVPFVAHTYIDLKPPKHNRKLN